MDGIIAFVTFFLLLGSAAWVMSMSFIALFVAFLVIVSKIAAYYGGDQ